MAESIKDFFKSGKRISVLFYIAIGLFFAFRIFYASKAGNITTHTHRYVIDLLLLVAACVHILIRDRKDWKLLIFSAASIMLMIIYTRFGQRNNILIFIVAFAVAAIGCNISKLSKYIFVCSSVAIVLVLIVHALGIYEPSVFTRVHSDGFRYVDSLGFNSYSALSFCVMLLNFAYILMRKNLRYIEFLFIFIGDYAIYKIIDNKLTFATEVVLVVCLLLSKLLRNKLIAKRGFAIAMALIPTACFIASLLTAWFYTDGSTGILASINSAFSNRLHFGHIAMNEFPVTAFGYDVPMRGNLPYGATSTKPYFFIDNGYLFYLYQYGIILTVLIMAFTSITIYKAARDKNYVLFSLAIASAIGNMASSLILLLDLFIINPMVFCLPGVCFAAFSKKVFSLNCEMQPYKTGV